MDNKETNDTNIENMKAEEAQPVVFTPEYNTEETNEEQKVDDMFTSYSEPKEETVTPVETVEQTTETVEYTEEEKAALREKLAEEEVLENPNAKVVLNRTEEVQEIKHEIEENVTKNESLKFVIILGVILLIAVIAIPYLSDFFQL